MTVHQGAEFDDECSCRRGRRAGCCRAELVYTAVTRARRSVTLCAGPEVLAAAIGHRTDATPGLLARLREQVARPT